MCLEFLFGPYRNAVQVIIFALHSLVFGKYLILSV